MAALEKIHRIAGDMEYIDRYGILSEKQFKLLDSIIFGDNTLDTLYLPFEEYINKFSLADDFTEDELEELLLKIY